MITKPHNHNHKHVYDKSGKRLCCDQEEKIYSHANAEGLLKAHSHHDDEHDHNQEQSKFKQYALVLFSLITLLIGISLDNIFKSNLFSGHVRLGWYLLSYLPVAAPVMREALKTLQSKIFFTEFTLMLLATFGAFAIGEYPEAVAVMLFYAIGELFQSAAVNRAKNSIKALLDIRPASASVFRNNKIEEVSPGSVRIGEIIQVKNGQSVPLDGELISENGSLNTSALTGESVPRSFIRGDIILAGMLNVGKVIDLKVTKVFTDSSLAKILDLVENATSRKAPTELLIRKLSKIYTPIVFFLALALVLVPSIFSNNYDFNLWLYRSLIFLVISCPCALVISIPLGYFGGIGAASRNGILFKGSNYLETMSKLTTVVMDKTGTLTAGIFKVQTIESLILEKNEFLKIVAALEINSTHPIAQAIVKQSLLLSGDYIAKDVEEISGHGLKGTVNSRAIVAGNIKLLKKLSITYPAHLESIVDTVVVVAIDNKYAGYVTVADEIKTDSYEAISKLQIIGIKTIMLSGDKNAVTQKVAKELNVDEAFGDLLPEDKVKTVEILKNDPTQVVAFVGDGINDAPVLALSDVGIAMGGLGSDAAIQTANVVIQTDQPSKIVTAINISKATKFVVIQNITLAFAVKVLVLALGAGGIATMWEAVFADVGVALLAIMNAVRIQKMKF